MNRKINIVTRDVPRGTFEDINEAIQKHRDSLEQYLDLLIWWNDRVNLVSRDVSRETLWEHIRHSLLLSRFEAFQNAGLIVDAGTGGGLPGIPLAIVSPGKQFILNDIVTKKILAVRDMSRKLALGHVRAIDHSIESIEPSSPFLLVSKHSFKVNELWGMVGDKSWETMVLYKGLDFREELEGINEPIRIHCVDLSPGPGFYQGKALLFISRYSP